MKKLAAYFVAWDVVFILFLYLSTLMNLWINEYIHRTLDIASRIWLMPMIPILTGCLIAWLACIGAKCQATGKTALLELILVGIPMLCIASLPYLYFYTLPGIAHVIQIRVPFWLMQENVFRIGGIAFGYEIFIFTARMIKLKYSGKPTVQTDSSENQEKIS